MSENRRTIDPSECWVRHVKRAADGQVGAVELGRGSFIAAPLDGLNGRAGWNSAQITAVLSDDGGLTVTFPNVEGSDGILHRRRFAIRSSAGKVYRPGEEWLELYREPHDLLIVATPVQAELSSSDLTLTCWTVAGLLNRFRSNEFDVWDGAAPRDLIEHYSRAPVLVYGDDLTGIGTILPGIDPDVDPITGAIPDNFTGANGRDYIVDTSSAFQSHPDPATGQPTMAPFVDVGIGVHVPPFESDTWTVEAAFRISPPVGGDGVVMTLTLDRNYQSDISDPPDGIPETLWDPMLVVPLNLNTGDAPLTGNEIAGEVIPGKRVGIVAEGLHSIRVVCFREWVFVLIDGEVANSIRRGVITGPGQDPPSSGVHGDTPKRIRLELTGPAQATFRGFTVTALMPLALGGADRGDLHLPGLPPGGGLRLRTFDATRAYSSSLFDPVRSAQLPYLYSTGTEPASDGQIDTLNARGYRTGLAATASAAGVFTGAIRFDDLGRGLRITAGDNADNVALRGRVRLWIAGKLIFNNFDAIGFEETILTYPWETGAIGPYLYSDASDPDDWPAGQWFPLRVETRCDGTGSDQLTLERETAPGSGVYEVVPNVDLSPLGTYDAEYRNESHRTIIGEVVETFGYQWRVEPRSLESGEFPGQIIPRVRVGTDYDVILDVDDGTDFVSTVDAGDTGDRLVADAAGLADPSGGGQLSGELVDFDNAALQAFLSSNYESLSDITVEELLIRRLNSLLGLRSAPNETVGIRPRGQRDLSKPPNLFPLAGTGELEKIRWLPGDALRLNIEPLDVADRTPRQLTRVVTAVYPDGVTPPQVGLRDRPRDSTTLLRRLLRIVLAPQRTYQGQLAFLTGAAGAGGTGASAGTDTFSRVVVPQDASRIVGAWVVVRAIAYDVNGEPSIELNNVDLGIIVTGPGWYDVKSYIGKAPGTVQAHARLINGTGGGYELNLVLLART